ncbi:hypothetical protein VPH35_121654 [Triticum aestivum]
MPGVLVVVGPFPSHQFLILGSWLHSALLHFRQNLPPVTEQWQGASSWYAAGSFLPTETVVWAKITVGGFPGDASGLARLPIRRKLISGTRWRLGLKSEQSIEQSIPECPFPQLKCRIRCVQITKLTNY